MKNHPEVKATKTSQGKNRFEVRFYLRVTEEGTLLPVPRKLRRSSHHAVTLTLEYPTYQEELDMKKSATRYDKEDHVHWIDHDVLSEARLRRCLVKWNLHEVFPELEIGQIHRIQGQLADDAFEMWQQLPPLLRKEIINLIHKYVGMA